MDVRPVELNGLRVPHHADIGVDGTTHQGWRVGVYVVPSVVGDEERRLQAGGEAALPSLPALVDLSDPIIPIEERYGNNPALEGVRVKQWPADDDPIMLNAPYADNFTTLLMFKGGLDPALAQRPKTWPRCLCYRGLFLSRSSPCPRDGWALP